MFNLLTCKFAAVARFMTPCDLVVERSATNWLAEIRMMLQTMNLRYRWLIFLSCS